MIAATMLSLTLLGTLIALAAWAIERAAIRLALPRRFTWMVAMLAMCAAPLLPDGMLTRVPVAPFAPTATEMTVPQLPVQPTTAVASDGWWPPYAATARFFGALPLAILVGTAQLIAASAALLRPLDGVLLVLWGAVSLGLAALTWRAVQQLHRQRRHWITRQRGGVGSPAVYVSDDIGPAAFGVAQGEIVIPRWAMTLPPLERRLLLLHERSHIEAGDPRLLAFGLALVILLPWHLPLRWAYRRLQRAIEHDCDRRVLHKPQLTRRYAELLLQVAERGMAARGWRERALGCFNGPTPTMTSLLCGEPALAARLRGLVAPPVTTRSRIDAAGGLALGTMLTLAATTVPIPQQPLHMRIRSFAPIANGGMLQRDERFVNGVGVERAIEDQFYFQRTDSLVIDAIARTRPALMRLAATTTPYVAVALTPDNEVFAHSIRAGVPPAALRDTAFLRAEIARAAATAGVSDGWADANYTGTMQVVLNNPKSYLQGVGISHLKVGENPLTVLWVRFKAIGD